MAWNKKGIAEMFIVVMVLALFSTGALVATISKVFVKGDDVSLEFTCERTIDARAASVLWAKTAFMENKLNLIPPVCATIDKDLEGNEEEIMREIADLSARCWDIFGEGRHEEILGDDYASEFSRLVGIDKVKNDCFICYTVTINEDDFGSDVNKITTPELLNFMYEEEYRKVVDYTYLEYIQEYGGPGKFGILLTGKETSMYGLSDTTGGIEPRSTYAISYLAKNKALTGDEGWSALWKASVATTATAVGVIAFSACTISTLGVCAAGVAAFSGGAVAGYSAVNDVKKLYYDDERDVSAIYIDDLPSAQAQCFTGDLGGK